MRILGLYVAIGLIVAVISMIIPAVDGTYDANERIFHNENYSMLSKTVFTSAIVMIWPYILYLIVTGLIADIKNCFKKRGLLITGVLNFFY